MVVLNWNGGDQNLACLDSLERAGIPRGDVVFVDNGSSDGSVEAVERAFPGVCVLRNGANLGFCGGCNVGLRHVLAGDAGAVLLLNNDVVVHADFLAPLLRALDTPNVGAAGPKMMAGGTQNVIWCAGGHLRHRANVSCLRGFGQVDRGQWDREEDVDYIPACALLVRRDALEACGFLDEDFFAYMEDVDYGVRLRKHGFATRYVPSSVIDHHSSASSGGGYTEGRKYANALNSVRFLRKHGTVRGWLGLLVFDVLGLPIAWWLQVVRRGNPAAVAAKARGLVDGFLGRRVSAEALAKWRARTEGHGRSRRPISRED